MAALLLTIGLLLALILTVERVSWVLFRRKMEPMRFPSTEDPSGSHNYWLNRMRIMAVIHTIILCVFIVIFCSALW